ncbi:hypothetical protein DL770_008565 [Monosporascus sp. CRB-9-2]|nr:hypothetical protein DL770_008565 [Monosporascus sp. CRB-9-2]
MVLASASQGIVREGTERWMSENCGNYLRWTEPDYSVWYAMGDSPLGPLQREAKSLQQDDGVAWGSGHSGHSGHSGVINMPGTTLAA